MRGIGQIAEPVLSFQASELFQVLPSKGKPSYSGPVWGLEVKNMAGNTILS